MRNIRLKVWELKIGKLPFQVKDLREPKRDVLANIWLRYKGTTVGVRLCGHGERNTDVYSLRSKDNIASEKQMNVAGKGEIKNNSLRRA